MNKLELSDRMKLIAELCTGGVTADVGTDHGFIPIWLAMNGKCKKVILSDINEGPLNSARENIRLYSLEERITDLRLGSGLSVLEPFEADTVIIAGMGGELICEILAEDIAKSRSYNKLILQPRTKVSVLREWLDKNGFLISHDLLVKEKDRICSVICTSPGVYEQSIPYERFESRADFIYPPFITGSDTPLCREYINSELTRLEKLSNELSQAAENTEARQKLEETKSLITYLKNRTTK